MLYVLLMSTRCCVGTILCGNDSGTVVMLPSFRADSRLLLSDISEHQKSGTTSVRFQGLGRFEASCKTWKCVFPPDSLFLLWYCPGVWGSPPMGRSLVRNSFMAGLALQNLFPSSRGLAVVPLGLSVKRSCKRWPYFSEFLFYPRLTTLCFLVVSLPCQCLT